MDPVIYKPLNERTLDYQYQDALRTILRDGTYIKNLFQEKGTFTSFDLPPLVYDLTNGFPLITERRIGFWRKFLAEIFAFINGARTLEDLRKFGTDKTWPHFWETWVTKEKCSKFGLPTGDLGSASYGPAMHDFPMPNGNTFNQFKEVLDQVRTYPCLRTHLVTTWIPFGAIQNKTLKRSVVVAPCHGTIIRLIIENERLTLQHVQRSCDLPVGGVGNIFQYAALTLAIAQVLEVTAYRYIHFFLDAQIYENQVDHVKKLLTHEPKPFSTLRITDPTIKNIFDFREEHFKLTDYESHESMNDIPVT